MYGLSELIKTEKYIKMMIEVYPLLEDRKDLEGYWKIILKNRRFLTSIFFCHRRDIQNMTEFFEIALL